MAAQQYVGRHRLGTPGLVHCVMHRPVADALADRRRSVLSMLVAAAKHRLTGVRRHTRVAVSGRIGTRPKATT